MQPKQNLAQNIIFFLAIFNILLGANCNNISICSKFNLDGVWYTVNEYYDNRDYFNKTSNQTYNFCNEIQKYCKVEQFLYISCWLIKNDCECYEQSDVSLIEYDNISSGIMVQYQLKSNHSQKIKLEFWCNGTGIGCPDVEQSTIFTFFNDKQLGFSISLQIIGVIFMTLGVYIYRVSIILLGAFSMFIALLAIEIPVIFLPGIPVNLISNVLILTGICSFFAGYVFGYFPKMGIFLLGGWIGIIISLTLNNVALYFIKSTPANLALWIIMPVLGILFGILSLYITRAFTIFATSLIGAYLSLRGLSWYLGEFPNEFLLPRRYHLGLSGVVSWKFYIYVIALVILTAASSALQNWLFQQKSKITKNKGNIDQEFGEMEEKMKAERENLAEIADFKELFQKVKNKAPKILKRSNKDEEEDEEKDKDSQDSDEHKEDSSHDQKQQVDQQQAQNKKIPRKQLTKKLLQK